jgi:hypothetical protein
MPIFGDFRELAYYYADVFIGSSRQKFTVIADTGSSLMEVPCFDCGNCGAHMNPKFQPSQSSTAVALHCSAGCPTGAGCNHGTDECTYSQSYAEGSTISGRMYRDRVYLGGDGDASPSAPTAGYAIDFNFGCGLVEGGLFNSQDADGIMGLGMGDLSMTRAMWANPKIKHRIFSMCLSFVGGAMTFGFVEERMHKAPVAWASLNAQGFYVVTVNAWALEGERLDAGGMNSPHTIVDSGTTFTYVPTGAFNSLLRQIDSFCQQPGKCRGRPRTIAQETKCYDVEDISTFPSLSFSFAGFAGAGDVNVHIAPAHLFVNMGWDNGAYCLAVYDNGSGGGVIGGNAMMGHDVVFDLENTRIGFADSDCVLDPSWIDSSGGEVSPSNSPSNTPSPTPTGSDSGTASNTPSITPTPTTTASNGTVLAGAGDDSARGPTNSLPSVSALMKNPTFINVGIGLVVLASCAGFYACVRRRGCEVRVGAFVFKIDAATSSLAYSRVGAPSSVPTSASKSKPAPKGPLGTETIAEESDEDFDDDLEEIEPIKAGAVNAKRGAAVRAVTV